MQRTLPTLLLIFLLCTCASAQKKSITVEDMQQWNQISNEQISPDGTHVFYTLEKDLGDPTAVIYDVKAKTERRFPRLHRAKLSYDGKYLIGLLKPGMAEVKALKLKEKKEAKDKLKTMDTLLVWNLTDAEPQLTPNVYGFKTSERWSDRYAYTTASTLPDSLQKEMDKDVHRLLVRNFYNQDSSYLEGIKSYEFARDAPVIVAHQTAKDSSWEASILRLTPDQLIWESLSKNEGDYTGISISNDGKQVAFLSSKKDAKDKQKPFFLHHWRGDDKTAERISDDPEAWLEKSFRISDDRELTFSEFGDYLFFGTTPRRPERDTSLLDEEIADVEIWTTEDDRMYTEENVRLKREEKRTYLATYRTKTNDFLQLGSTDRPYDYQANDQAGHYVMVYDDRPYTKQTMWEGGSAARNTTIIDLRTGKRTPMLNGEITPARWLDGGKYLIWYNPTDTTWNSFDPVAAKHHVLTTNATGIFYDEVNDRPMHPRSYGYEGTLSRGNRFWVADRYDLWELDPTGINQPTRITRGREKSTRYRIIQLDDEDRFIRPIVNGVMLSSFNEKNYNGGYGTLDLDNNEVNIVEAGPVTYGGFQYAKGSGGMIFTRGDFRTFPDLQLAKDERSAGSQISTANPQQADFAWGTNETYEWTDLQGRTLRGMLVKPDNFDPTKKYPLLVNFYERSSPGVYRHRTPVPGRSSINYSHYVSKGYMIFNPDVVYRVGYPGESAYDCVMSGITSLLSEGYIDKKRIGMQGHSWGGYQAAYLVTKTDLFAAVESGAPVVNMFSAYGGIRWGSGRSRQFQYEHTQSRIGGTPWSHFQRYYENSPIFTTDKINTPLLILHNDNDSAVPWEQGIEWFTALRRLGKPAWMLNYRGEPHWPVKTANRADFQTRMAEFFDHYLMNKPMPGWMADGIAPIYRGKE
jgi:dipeptidyl aminopeptidase/acylaminoacyl peptidase